MRCGGVVRNLVSMAVVTMLALAGCASEAATPPERAEPPTTATEAPTTTSSTTTTTAPATDFEPLYADPELELPYQVEAAYLFHWEVLLDAYATGRTDYLHLVYHGEALSDREAELEGIVRDGFRVQGHVDHNMAINLLVDGRVIVTDEYENHMYRVGADDGAPLGEASGTRSAFEYMMELIDGRWMVTGASRVS